MAEAAEAAGFDGISLMDHLMQIPQVGREWEEFPEVFSALGFLAGRTTRLSLGAMVTNVRLRNPALLAKMLATINVLSGGRTFCGLGAGWFKSEQVAYGYEFESPGRRLDRLEDALTILPLMWGPGKATHQGKVESVIEAVCYPRPVGKIPIIVGGRSPGTIKLAGSLADGLNVVGTRNLREHVDLFRASAVEASRDPDALEVSVLDTPLLGSDRSDVAALVEANRGRLGASVFAAGHHAGTVIDHIDRLRALAGTGVGAIYISPVGLTSAEGVAAWKPVIDALG
jgi:alkanesulfonate monooxygenase SsuD/methylene tetrahydromethanopterin reductase-like flavin-dependent oxidoreductase (luciferase family)